MERKENELRISSISQKVIGIAAAVLLSVSFAHATPSTHIWIPSTDIQPYKKIHFGLDTYIKTQRVDGDKEPTVTNAGLTVGILPFEKVQAEIGVDYRDIGGDHRYPLYFNAKIGIPEDALGKNVPAFAIGAYDFGTKSDMTDYNIVYGIAAKTVGQIGRFSVGYYTGNDNLLRKLDGSKDNHGVLLAWDRTISEISDKLWAAIDYQGGRNSYGALSFGVAWKFAPNVSVIFGYDIYNESRYKPTATLQLDIDF